jgi:pilus assembly protein CpaD
MRPFHVLRACTVLGVLGVAACASPVNGPDQAFDPNTRYPITVEPRMMVLHLPYGGPNARLDQNLDDQLTRFAHDYLDHGSGAIAVSAPRRDRDAPDYYATRLVALGVPRAHILLGNQDGPDGGDQVKLTYIRYSAETPACGDWSKNLGDTADNSVSPNFGCATQHNLAAMVSDPRDLVAPRDFDPDDAQRRLAVLDKYRKGQSTVAEKTKDQSAAISDVGGDK